MNRAVAKCAQILLRIFIDEPMYSRRSAWNMAYTPATLANRFPCDRTLLFPICSSAAQYPFQEFHQEVRFRNSRHMVILAAILLNDGELIQFLGGDLSGSRGTRMRCCYPRHYLQRIGG